MSRGTAVFGKRAACIVFCVVAGLPSVAAEDTLRGGRYRIESRMVLPHLEEMRRIVDVERACLPAAGVTGLFPVFRQPAMTGCTLVRADAGATPGAYVLHCVGNNGATGSAVIAWDSATLTGVLRAKMGGKNMTFSQHVSAHREGDCEP